MSRRRISRVDFVEFGFNKIQTKAISAAIRKYALDVERRQTVIQTARSTESRYQQILWMMYWDIDEAIQILSSLVSKSKNHKETFALAVEKLKMLCEEEQAI